MKISLEQLPQSRVQLDIEVDPDRLEQSLDQASRRIAQKSKIPGFRPGKAPRRVVERMVGREGLIREALEKLVPDVYNEAIEAEDIDAIGQPDLEIVELDPVRFKATVPVRPNVELGDYRSIRLERAPVEVTDEEVEEQITQIRRHHATQAPVDRGIQWEDVVVADVEGTVEGSPFVKDEDAEFALREGQQLLLPGLAEAFLGMKAGDEKKVELEIPEDFGVERLNGKTATFTLRVKAAKEEILPEADDELAQMVNADEFETIDALRDRIRADLLESKKRREESEFRVKAVDALIEKATLDYPEILVEHEIDHLVRDAVGNNQQAFAAHLAQIGKSPQEFRETFREVAEQRVKRSLVLEAFAKAEDIKIEDAEVEAERDKLIEPLENEPNAEYLRQMFSSAEGLATIGRNLLTDKTFERLQAIVSGQVEEEQPA